MRLRQPANESVLRMFDGRAFCTWPHILLGAVAFAGLFALLALMIELVFEGRLYVSRTVTGLGLGAFVGYVATAWLVRPVRFPTRRARSG